MIFEAEVDSALSSMIHADAEEIALLFVVVVVFITKASQHLGKIVAAEEVTVFLAAFEIVMEGLLYDGHKDICSFCIGM